MILAVVFFFFIICHCFRSGLPKVSPLLCTINGLQLPNSDFTGYDDETVATALGHVAHLVTLIAKYLGVPFRYPVHPMCSRSTIRVSDQSDPRRRRRRE